MDYTDGSFIKKDKEERASYGIYFGENSGINIKMRTRGKQTVNNAEIQVVEHTLLVIPTEQNTVIGLIVNLC